jgi:signal transduction histidine kinase
MDVENSTGSDVMFESQLDQLTSEIRQLPALPLHETLEQACSRLAGIEPLTSAGIFRLDEAVSSLEWLYASSSSIEDLSHSMQHNYAEISDMLTNGHSVQYNASDFGQDSTDVFVGLPAGTFDGRSVALGLSSNRTLSDEELVRLGLFGWLVALSAENARLSSMTTGSDEAGSTARLIGFIAHELRTPLTGMRGNIQLALMANRKQQHDRIPARLEAAIDGVDDMTELVQKLLDVSRLERGVFTLNLQEAPLANAVTAAVDSVTAGQEAKEQEPIEIQVESLDSLVVAHDQEAIQKSISYLISSASHYAELAEPLRITASEDTEGIHLCISYSGAPLSDDDMAALSVPLSSSRPSSERSDHHLSLELAFCRGVMQKHDGEILVHADYPSPGQHQIEIVLPNQVA